MMSQPPKASAASSQSNPPGFQGNHGSEIYGILFTLLHFISFPKRSWKSLMFSGTFFRKGGASFFSEPFFLIRSSVFGLVESWPGKACGRWLYRIRTLPGRPDRPRKDPRCHSAGFARSPQPSADSLQLLNQRAEHFLDFEHLVGEAFEVVCIEEIQLV